jgi:hypothetical protein
MRRALVFGVAAVVLVSGCGNDVHFFGQSGSDLWAQAPNNEVDILFMVDNSASMGEEQQALADGFDDFIGNMESTGTDFHLGLISSDLDPETGGGGKLIGEPTFLTNATPDYSAEFKARALIGTLGDDFERGLGAVDVALSPALQAGYNAGFLRSEAQLLIVFVSDEEDCSDNYALLGQDPKNCYSQRDALVPVETYINTWQNLKVDPDYVQAASIVGLDGTCATAHEGDRYMEASGYTNGVVGDICNTEWGGIMYDVGLNATSIKTTFVLTQAAVVDSLKVMVDHDGTDQEPDPEEKDDVEVEQSPSNGWTYDAAGPSITFHGTSIPERGAAIFAYYNVDPNGPADAPAPSSTTATGN